MRTVCKVASVPFSMFLMGVAVFGQAAFPVSDSRIKAQLTVDNPTRKVGQPVVVDVHIENLEQADIRKNQFSPVSSSVGLPSFRIVPVGGEEILIPPGLFIERPDDWEHWYQPTVSRVGTFILPAKTRIHLLHGDLRLLLEDASAYCQRELARGTLIEQPEERATKKYYQDVVRFARLFSSGGAYDVTVWAYAQSNTVRIQIER